MAIRAAISEQSGAMPGYCLSRDSTTPAQQVPCASSPLGIAEFPLLPMKSRSATTAGLSAGCDVSTPSSRMATLTFALPRVIAHALSTPIFLCDQAAVGFDADRR